jgi:hypothetical protein
MAKINSAFHGSNRIGGNRNNLLNLKYFNELKKDQTNIKIFKNSSFDSSFNSVQSLNTNLSQLMLLPSPDSFGGSQSLTSPLEGVAPNSYFYYKNKNKKGCLSKGISTKNIKTIKFSAILRAIRSIRLNRDEWKLIRYINLMGKKIRSSPFFGCFASAQSLGNTNGGAYLAPANSYFYSKNKNKKAGRLPKQNVDFLSLRPNAYQAEAGTS